jgi:hypothetical protein
MSVAALTPRVRIMVICEEVIASDTEPGVFTLEGVRQFLSATSFPWPAPLSLFLLLSSARRGTYAGKVLMIHDATDRTIRYVKFEVEFQRNNEVLPVGVDLDRCEFPQPGGYTFQVWFAAKKGADALKAEQPFDVLQDEE